MATSISDFTVSEREVIASIAMLLKELPAAKQRVVVEAIVSLANLPEAQAAIAAGVMEIAATRRPARRLPILEFVAQAESLEELWQPFTD